MKNNKICAIALSFGLLTYSQLSAATNYIGDAAAEGTSVTAGNTNYGLSTLTIAMHTGSPTIYTAPSDQDLQFTEVNFFTSEFAGTVTPFVAIYDGVNSTLASGYEILAIGDALTVTAGAGLENRAFTVGGLMPTFSVSSGDQIIAGFLDEGKVISLNDSGNGGGSGLADYVGSGDYVTGQSIGSAFSANSDFNGFDVTMQYNIGYEVIPEPSAFALIAGGLALGAIMTRRRRA